MGITIMDSLFLCLTLPISMALQQFLFTIDYF